MAKVVCKNCGHKNPSSAAVCENCGSFMFEDPKPAVSGTAPSAPQNIEQEPQQVTVPDNSPPQPVDQAPRQAPETIRVTGSGILQQMSTFVGFLILGVFFILEYNGYLSNMYYFLIFFVLILAVPTLMRTATSVVKFNGPNFTFRGSANSGSYDIKDVENITIDQYNKQDQTMTINFKTNQPPLQVEFNSVTTFRSAIVAFTRRRIVVIPMSRTQNSPGTGS